MPCMLHLANMSVPIPSSSELKHLAGVSVQSHMGWPFNMGSVPCCTLAMRGVLARVKPGCTWLVVHANSLCPRCALSLGLRLARVCLMLEDEWGMWVRVRVWEDGWRERRHL